MITKTKNGVLLTGTSKTLFFEIYGAIEAMAELSGEDFETFMLATANELLELHRLKEEGEQHG